MNITYLEVEIIAGIGHLYYGRERKESHSTLPHPEWLKDIPKCSRLSKIIRYVKVPQKCLVTWLSPPHKFQLQICLSGTILWRIIYTCQHR